MSKQIYLSGVDIGIPVGFGLDVNIIRNMSGTQQAPNVNGAGYSRSAELVVSSPVYAVDDYVAVTELQPTGEWKRATIDGVTVKYEDLAPRGYSVQSADTYPLSAKTDFVFAPNGDVMVVPAYDLDQMVPCSGRWRPDRGGAVETNGTKWDAFQGDEKFSLLSGVPPVILGPNEYARHDPRGRDFVPCYAARFDGEARSSGDEEFLTGTRSTELRCGVMAALSMKQPEGMTAVVGWGPGNERMVSGAWIDVSGNIVVSDSQGVLGAVETQPLWLQSTIVLTLVVGPVPGTSQWSVKVVISAPNSLPEIGEWVVPKDRALRFVFGSLSLFAGDNESSSELLDMLVWRRSLTDIQILQGYALMKNIYGI